MSCLHVIKMTQCIICCENIVTPVVCQCSFTCCRKCVRTYLSEQISEAHCMKCKEAWSFEFLEEAIGKTYLNTDYKKSRAKVYLEFEKTQLAQTQDLATKYLKDDKYQKKIAEMRAQNKELSGGTYGCTHCLGAKYKSFWCKPCKTEAPGSIEAVHHHNMRLLNKFQENKLYDDGGAPMYRSADHKNRFQCECLMYSVDANLSCSCGKKYCYECLSLLPLGKTKCETCKPLCICLEYKCDKCTVESNISLIVHYQEMMNEKVHSEKKSFIMRCQVENCQGFLSTQYKCGLCKTNTCPTCYTVKDEGHVCNPDDVSSARMIREETKPCPTCTTRIYKIDGCDQMWCIECKTAFSWKSGEIVNGKIHNPHYYEYLRKTQGFVPRADAPNPCQDAQNLPYLRMFFQKNRTQQTRNHPLYLLIEKSVFQLYRFLEELRMQDVNQHENSLVNNRIQFLINRIDEKRFAQDAFMYFQRSVQFRRYVELITMLRDVVTDLNAQIIEKLKGIANLEKTWQQIQEIFMQIINVCIYFNTQHTKNPFTTIRQDHSRIWAELHSYESISKTEPVELRDIKEWVGTKETFIYLRTF